MKLFEAVHHPDCKDKQHVFVKSYGYMERGIMAHFEPFSSQRTIEFDLHLNVDQYEDGSYDEDYWAEHETFFFDENESELDGFEIEDGKITIFDPEISCRP